MGELADGLYVDLDTVTKKYDGLDGTELAISESQERMACAVADGDVEEFMGYAAEENLEATVIAEVTAEPRMRMAWNGVAIVDLSREFLNSNGAPKHQVAHVCARSVWQPSWAGTTLAERMTSLVTDLNVASNKGLSERFDSTIGAATVLMPFGGKTQLTPSSAMVAKFPVGGETTTASAMAWGFNPYLMEADQFAGAYLSVVESIAKLVAAGFEHKRAYLSFQEYFERLRTEAERWGKPTAAVLGALMAQVDLGAGAIGGKDSMSGSFEDEAGELEKETESPTEGSENEGAPVEVQPESGDPEEEVSGTETETEGDGEQKDNLVAEQPITFAVPRISSEEELPVYKVGEKGGLDGQVDPSLLEGKTLEQLKKCFPMRQFSRRQ